MDDFYYTIAPPQMQAVQDDKQSSSKLICYKGIKMYVRPYDDEHFQITDLCSSNPKDYLKADLMPGSLIQLFR